MALKDYYLILGVSRTETARGIQNTFRELVKQLHPDRVGPQGTAAFQDLVEAYQVLSDPERRKAYRVVSKISIEDLTPRRCGSS